MNIDEAIGRLKGIIYASHSAYFKNFELMYQDVDAIETIINEYNNLKQIEEAHRIENGKLRKIEKYVRSNEWSEDYKNSSCRTSILRILEEN